MYLEDAVPYYSFVFMALFLIKVSLGFTGKATHTQTHTHKPNLYFKCIINFNHLSVMDVSLITSDKGVLIFVSMFLLPGYK